MAPNASITCEKDRNLSFPVEFDCSNLKSIITPVPLTPLPEAVGKTLDLFRKLAGEGRVDRSHLT